MTGRGQLMTETDARRRRREELITRYQQEHALEVQARRRREREARKWHQQTDVKRNDGERENRDGRRTARARVA